MIRRILPKAIALFVVTVVAAEIFLRLFATSVLWNRVPLYYYREFFTSLFQHDPTVIFSKKPGTEAVITNSAGESISYKINSLGFRDVERVPSAGARPVLVLGDSFTFGVGAALERMYQQRAEAMLGIPVWNLGSLAFSVDQEWLTWREWSPKVNPRALVLQICVNDLSDLLVHEWVDEHGGVIPGFERLPASVRDVYWRENFWERFEIVNTLQYFFAVFQREQLGEDKMRLALGRMRLVLEAFRRETETRGIPMVLLQATGWGEEVYGKSWADEYRDTVTEALGPRAKWVRAPEIVPLSDLLPPPDLHWNAAGHEKIAEALSVSLRGL